MDGASKGPRSNPLPILVDQEQDPPWMKSLKRWQIILAVLGVGGFTTIAGGLLTGAGSLADSRWLTVPAAKAQEATQQARDASQDAALAAATDERRKALEAMAARLAAVEKTSGVVDERTRLILILLLKDGKSEGMNVPQELLETRDGK